jgi:hypothetical protein
MVVVVVVEAALLLCSVILQAFAYALLLPQRTAL